MGGGVAGAIKRAGGPVIEEEAIQRAPVAVGEAVATTAGRLGAKYVIHAPTMARPVMDTNLTNVEKATTAALNVARELRVLSIAIPGMGTGVGGVPVREAAQTMIGAIRRHLSEGTHPEVHFPDLYRRRVEQRIRIRFAVASLFSLCCEVVMLME